MTTATIVWAPVSSPPPPTPWIARNAISSSIEWANPASADPARKMTIAAMNRYLRPYWSPSLPHTWVVAVLARM